MNKHKSIFRGFHPDNDGKTVITHKGEKIKGDWIYWDLFGHSEALFVRKGGSGESILVHFVMPYDVITETIGQKATIDKNGKDMFGGDKVMDSAGSVGIVEWQQAECRFLIYDTEMQDWHGMDEYNWEVIGNVFEVTE